MTGLIVDNFAGGGGASTGMEKGLGRKVDIAINHDPKALAMHAANHPGTYHYCESVWDINPVRACEGRPIDVAWFSPDCKHFSRAKGGKPVDKTIRGLAWVLLRWASMPKWQRPRIIMLENVKEFLTWGPLTRSGRPIKAMAGKTFELWVSHLRALGYHVEWKILKASDYGAPTIRERLYLIARRDREPIVWGDVTHGDPKTLDVASGILKPWKTAASHVIDFSIPCPSIFLSKEEGRALGVNRPLRPNTLRRIALGIKRYVIEAQEPFIVTCNHAGKHFRGQGVNEPFKTLCAARDAHGLVMPIVTKFQQNSIGQRVDEPLHTAMAGAPRFGLVAPYLTHVQHASNKFGCMPIDEPLRTVTANPKGGGIALVAPVIDRQFGMSKGNSVEDPLGTVTSGGGGSSALVAAFLAQHNTGVVGHDARKPLSTIVGRGTQQQLVTSQLVPTIEATSKSRADEVRAFLIKYNGTAIGQTVQEPLHTIPTKDRFGLVMVQGEPYQIVDIGMRMLTQRELFNAQGFPADYIIDRGANGETINKTEAVRMCGNSVCPDVAQMLVEANCQFAMSETKRRAAV